MAQKQSVLYIISGSVAAYKGLEVIRLLREKNVDVTCVLTKGGAEFITPLSCASLTGNHVYTDLFSLTDESEMGHIKLSRENDLVVVAPASADIIGKMAGGIANDLASTLLLATDKPVLVAPAMNVQMWEHPAVKRNIKQIQEDGTALIGPGKGDLACGEQGFGRMAEPEEVARAVLASLEEGKVSKATKPLSGLKALVTSGPTFEAIDPVRYIANRSSGKQGHAISKALELMGAQVTLISGPSPLPDPVNVKVIKVESAREMLEAAYRELPVDIAVCAAAVSDWRISELSEQKIKKTYDEEDTERKDMVFTFMENPDILECISNHDKNRPELVIGFAAETENVVQNARDKKKRKGCDWILANDVSSGGVFGSDRTSVHFLTNEAQDDWPDMSKIDVAEKLAEKITGYFKKQKPRKLRKVV